MKQFSARILKNVPVADNFFELTLLPEEPVSQPLPGQFLTLRVTSSTTPLLRRPFAYSGTDDITSSFSIIYQKRGNATDILAGKQIDEHIDCIGPLGNNFQLPENSQIAILVAGGIGIGPILFLASELQKKKLPFKFIFGCRSKQFIPDLKTFSQLEPIICTDDGSYGFKGTTADYLAANASVIPSNSIFYTCGPDRMLHACYQFSKKKAAKCWVSVEQVMACGVGACMGCVVKVNAEQKYLRACKEGPVFDADILLWEDQVK
jgi:dihydroorotate dehydrogenase electron transfer subunit